MKILISVLCIIILLLISYLVGVNISIVNQMMVYVILKDIAITIFTIMGIWLAILQSDSLKKIFNIGADLFLNPSERRWLRNILLPILISSLILIVIIIVSLADIFFKSFILGGSIIECLRQGKRILN